MPELPEVETTRRGLLPDLTGQRVDGLVVRQRRLRYPLPRKLAGLIAGQTLQDIDRRGKYLLFRFARGTLIVHLGMSGSLRLVRAAESPAKWLKRRRITLTFEMASQSSIYVIPTESSATRQGCEGRVAGGSVRGISLTNLDATRWHGLR